MEFDSSTNGTINFYSIHFFIVKFAARLNCFYISQKVKTFDGNLNS